MPHIHDTRFPTAISLRASGGPERLTRIVTLTNGFEERTTPWAQSRRRYDAGYGVRSLDDIHEIIAFFEGRMGRLHGFRWKDWSDWRSGPPSQPPTPLDQRIGTGDGAATAFQLVKIYTSGAQSHSRPITHPVAGSVRIAVDGIEATFTLEDGGLIRLSAPAPPGAIITAGFEFDVPVRFDSDRLDINLAGFEAGEIPSIPLIELKG